MQKQHTLRVARCVGVAITLAFLLAFASEYPQAQGPGQAQDPSISAQERAQCLNAPGARTARALRTGAISFVGTEAGRPIPNAKVDAAASAESAARSYLDACGSLFGLTDQGTELTLKRNMSAGGGRSAVRFQQTQGGIPILGAELIVNLDANKNILSVSGETLPKPAISSIASINASSALKTALEATAKSHGVEISTLSASAPELWYYAPALIGPFDGAPSLVWRIEVATTELKPIRELVLVDAAEGSVPLHFNQAETAKNRETYNGGNTTTLPGTLVCNESNPTCSGGDADAVAAHVYAGHTYDFYLANHGRDSLNNAGLTLRSTVHYGAVGYQNAFWNGTQMAYGDGFSRSDDVVGHELTHGVTQYTSDLFYYYQSGAINESFSDAWGEFIDLTNGAGTDTAGVRWLMGEDIPGGAIRSMQDPTIYGDPDKMTSVNYYTGALDNGGVHSNSGLNNKAVFLMVDGGTFNGQTVAALGITKVAKIYYEVQTHLLTSGSDYGDLYNALFQGCTNLVGTAGITAGDCTNVQKATIATEMHLQPVPNFNTDAAVCASGSPVNLFFDNVESGLANWTAAATTGTNRWVWGIGFAHSGLYSLWANDNPGAITDTTATMNSSIMLPAGAYLHFSHAYHFETPNFDGGVIEYSTNGGTSWTDASSLIEVNGYTGTIDTGYMNPLGGRTAYIGISHGYISSRLNLSTLAGQNVKFRFRVGLDSSVSALGWFVDDVRIYTCGGAPTRIIGLSGSLAFGERHVGSSNTATLTIGNSGNSTMTVSSITYPPGFSGAFSGTIPAGGSQPVTVTFTPTAKASYGGTVTVNADQTSGTPTTTASGVGSTDSTRDGDYDGDGKTELAIYRASEGRWYLQRSVGGYSSPIAYSWGLSTDLPYPGDYDGDGKTDLAIFRPSTGHWFILLSGSNFTTYVVYQFGTSTDIPVPGDFDGDDKTDIGIWRPSTGTWFVLTSTSGYTAYFAFNWGTSGDVPVATDWDGDGKADIGVYRAPGYWLVRTSTSGYSAGITIQWGAAGDTPVPGDYDGDKKTDPAVYRSSTGQWFVLKSSTGYTSPAGYQWGASGDQPIVGDFDADGKADVSIFRPSTGHWFILRSINNYTTFVTYQWGMSSDIVLPRRP